MHDQSHYTKLLELTSRCAWNSLSVSRLAIYLFPAGCKNLSFWWFLFLLACKANPATKTFSGPAMVDWASTTFRYRVCCIVTMSVPHLWVNWARISISCMCAEELGYPLSTTCTTIVDRWTHNVKGLSPFCMRLMLVAFEVNDFPLHCEMMWFFLVSDSRVQSHLLVQLHF